MKDRVTDLLWENAVLLNAGGEVGGEKFHDWHELLLEQGDASYTVRRFEEECCLLSQIRHPNIVQFLGVYFQQRVRVPRRSMNHGSSCQHISVPCTPALVRWHTKKKKKKSHVPAFDRSS